MAFGRASVAKVPAEWIKRLAAAERRAQKQAATVEKLAATVQKLSVTVSELSSTVAQLSATVDRRLGEIDAARTAQATSLANAQEEASRTAAEAAASAVLAAQTLVEELAARTMENHHANAAGIDALNRAQAEFDERLVGVGIEHRTATEQLQGVLADQARHAAEADARGEAVKQELSGAISRLEGVLADVGRHHDEQARQLVDGIDRERHDRLEAAEQLAVTLDIVTAAAATDRAASSERSGALEERVRLVETALVATTVRLDDLNTSRAEVIERLESLNTSVGISIVAAEDGINQLTVRVESAESTAAAHAEAASALTSEIAERLDLVIDRIEPLGQAISTVVRLDEAVAAMGDRITAAELLLNQRDDLELQLDRAEEFERLVAEIDPDRYATREALEELRLLITPHVMDDHDA